MQYQLTEEQTMIRDNVRKLVKEFVEPRAGEIDESGEYPWDIKKLFCDQGLLSLSVPEQYGGSASDLLSYCLVVEEVARASAAAALIIASQELGMVPILIGGNEEQKKKWLPRIASGEVIIAYGLTEPGAGSDVASMKTKAVRDGDDYILNGTKCFITNAGIAQYYTVFAVTDPGQKSKGISAFLVEKDTPGFTFGKKEKKMGIRGTLTAELIFENVRVPVANRIGAEGKGFTIAMQTLDKTRPGIGAQALGIAQGALDCALQYAQERKQFGTSIASFQAIQFMLADMVTQIECARQLVYKTACMMDQVETGLVSASEASRFSAMAKLFASDTAMRVTTDAVQILGGYGYMKDYPVERMMRDAKITQIYEGTNQIQRIVIAKNLFDCDPRG